MIVAYTKAAASGYADIVREVIEPAIEAGNESFQLSGIGHIKLHLVRAYQTNYVESGDQFVHLWRFADKGDGYMDEIHELRDRYRADVAILVVDDPDGCGQATKVSADEDDAFAVVHHACAKANFSLVHEIGHLLGASHERGLVHANEWRDIMSYKANCGGCTRLPVWSNPNVLIRGVPAGSVGHDNARVIAEKRPARRGVPLDADRADQTALQGARHAKRSRPSHLPKDLAGCRCRTRSGYRLE